MPHLSKKITITAKRIDATTIRISTADPNPDDFEVEIWSAHGQTTRVTFASLATVALANMPHDVTVDEDTVFHKFIARWTKTDWTADWSDQRIVTNPNSIL